jgi:hypothetical protein
MRGDETVEVLRADWAELHFELKILESQDQRLWLLRESREHETGRGFYAFRQTPAMPVVLEAPHSFGDKHTRYLTAQLFLDSRFAAAAWNTVHRKIVDVAHTDGCFLNAFTRAFVRVHRDHAVVCQLHGFSRAKRTTHAGRASDLIVSNGTRSAGFWLHRAVLNLREMSADIEVRLFPDEVSELGAITNRQGRLIRDTGAGKFLHLEMSAELRDALISWPARQSELLKTLEGVFRTHCGECAEPKDFETSAAGEHSTACDLIWGLPSHTTVDQFTT